MARTRSKTTQPDAIELLKKDHKAVDELFDEFEQLELDAPGFLKMTRQKLAVKFHDDLRNDAAGGHRSSVRTHIKRWEQDFFAAGW